MNIKKITVQAIIAALYAGITLVLSSISFGAIQIRLASCLWQLIPYNKKYFIGITLGLICANLFSPNGIIDLPFGLATSLLAFIIYVILEKNISNKFAKKIVMGVCITLATICVALELNILYNAPILLTWLTVAIGQGITQIIGIFLFAKMNKICKFEDKV